MTRFEYWLFYETDKHANTRFDKITLVLFILIIIGVIYRFK